MNEKCFAPPIENSSVFWMLPIRPFSNAAIRVRPCQRSHPMPVSRMSVLMLTCCRAAQGICGCQTSPTTHTYNTKNW